MGPAERFPCHPFESPVRGSFRGDENRAAGVERALPARESHVPESALHRLIETLRAKCSGSVCAQDAERRQRFGFVVWFIQFPDRPHRRCESLLRKIHREPLEAGGIRHGAKLGRIVGRVIEGGHRTGCVAAHDRGRQASDSTCRVEAPVAHELDDTRCERRWRRRRRRHDLRRVSGSSRFFAHESAGPAHVGKYRAGLNGCELRRVAEHHEPGPVRNHGEHLRHEREIHH